MDSSGGKLGQEPGGVDPIEGAGDVRAINSNALADAQCPHPCESIERHCVSIAMATAVRELVAAIHPRGLRKKKQARGKHSLGNFGQLRRYMDPSIIGCLVSSEFLVQW